MYIQEILNLERERYEDALSSFIENSVLDVFYFILLGRLVHMLPITDILHKFDIVTERVFKKYDSSVIPKEKVHREGVLYISIKRNFEYISEEVPY